MSGLLTPSYDAPESVARTLSACALVLRILERNKTRRWDDLEPERLPDLTPHQREIIAENEHIVRLIRGRIASTKQPRVGLLACPVCGRWCLTATGASSAKKCTLTRECTGTLIPCNIAKDDT